MKPSSFTFATYITGLAVSRCSSWLSAFSSFVRPIERTGLPSSRCLRMRSNRSFLRAASLSPPLAALVLRSTAFSTDCRSVSASSVSMMSISEIGFTRPETCTMSVVFETAHHVRDRVGLADVREELVAEALALRRAGHEARDVDEFDRGRHDLLRLHDLRQRVEPQVRHRHDADVGVDGAERIVLRRDLRARQRVEQRGLADVGKTHDAALDTHRTTPFSLQARVCCARAICSWRSALRSAASLRSRPHRRRCTRRWRVARPRLRG